MPLEPVSQIFVMLARSDAPGRFFDFACRESAEHGAPSLLSDEALSTEVGEHVVDVRIRDSFPFAPDALHQVSGRFCQFLGPKSAMQVEFPFHHLCRVCHAISLRRGSVITEEL